MPGRNFYRYSVRVRSESTGQGVHSIGVAVSLSVNGAVTCIGDLHTLNLHISSP